MYCISAANPLTHSSIDNDIFKEELNRADGFIFEGATLVPVAVIDEIMKKYDPMTAVEDNESLQRDFTVCSCFLFSYFYLSQEIVHTFANYDIVQLISITHTSVCMLLSSGIWLRSLRGLLDEKREDALCLQLQEPR